MSDKTEKPTPKRREDARKRGQIARGAKLPAATTFLAALIMIKVTFHDWLDQARYLISHTLKTLDKQPFNDITVYQIFIDATHTLLVLTLPVMIAIFLGSLVGNFIQGGFTIIPEVFTHQMDRFNPLNNLKRIFSSQALVDLSKNTLELICLIIVGYNLFIPTLFSSSKLLLTPIPTIFVMIGQLLYSLSFQMGSVLIVFALADYGYKWYSQEKSLRMTKQEIKEEYRQQEGDPLVKGQRRRAARALVERRQMSSVSQASVIITNPTHYAVALKYNREEDAAPLVLAKGMDLMALRIRTIAEEHKIEIVENPPLARALYKAVEPGQTIPAEFFRAVAEVLAYIYRQRS